MDATTSLSLPLFQRLFLSNSGLPGTPVPTRTIQPSDPRHALEASKDGERRSCPATLWWLGVKMLIKHSAYKLRCPRGGWRGLTDKIESDARNQQSLHPLSWPSYLPYTIFPIPLKSNCQRSSRTLPCANAWFDSTFWRGIAWTHEDAQWGHDVRGSTGGSFRNGRKIMGRHVGSIAQ